MEFISEADEIKAYKAAKTGREMIATWSLKLGMSMEEALKAPVMQFLGDFADKAPNIIKTYSQDTIIQVMERRVLDLKTKELIMLAICAQMENLEGTKFHTQAARARGATEDEIIEVLYLIGYENGKNKTLAVGPTITEGLKLAEKF